MRVTHILPLRYVTVTFVRERSVFRIQDVIVGGEERWDQVLGNEAVVFVDLLLGYLG